MLPTKVKATHGYSYSKGSNAPSLKSVGGITLVPTAEVYLLRRGLLYRGTPYVV